MSETFLPLGLQLLAVERPADGKGCQGDQGEQPDPREEDELFAALGPLGSVATGGQKSTRALGHVLHAPGPVQGFAQGLSRPDLVHGPTPFLPQGGGLGHVREEIPLLAALLEPGCESTPLRDEGLVHQLQLGLGTPLPRHDGSGRGELAQDPLRGVVQAFEEIALGDHPAGVFRGHQSQEERSGEAHLTGGERGHDTVGVSCQRSGDAPQLPVGSLGQQPLLGVPLLPELTSGELQQRQGGGLTVYLGDHLPGEVRTLKEVPDFGQGAQESLDELVRVRGA